MGLLLATVAIVASFVHPEAAAAPARQLAATKQPDTLYTSPHGTIAAFAQDGSLLSWFAPSTKGCNTIRVLSLANGGNFTLPDERANSRNVTCQWDVAQPVRLALAGTNAIWTLRDRLSPLPFDYLLGAGYVDARERRFQEIAHAVHGAGLWFGGMAGDSKGSVSSLVYAVTEVAYVDELACLSNGSCALKVAGGGVHLIVGRRDDQIPNTSPAIAVAVSGSSVAYIPAATVGKNGQPLPSATLDVEVRDTQGKLLLSVNPSGTPIAVALSTGVLALLEQTKDGARLEWYATDTGKQGGSVPVPAGTAPELTANSQLIVFHVGNSLRAVNVTTQQVTSLGTSASTPIGLSLEGTRLAWAENVHGHGRVRALYIGGRG